MRQKSVEPPDSIESSAGQIELLRARVERQVRKPAIVVITSAKQGDGKSLTAFLLAKSFAKAGRRTVLVDTPHGASNEDAFIASHDFRDLLVRVQLPRSSIPRKRQLNISVCFARRTSLQLSIAGSYLPIT